MAKQTDTQIEGTYGDIICYKWKGRYLVRSKGRTGTQAPVAKMQAGILGKASAISAKIRLAMKPILSDPKDRSIMYRLNNVLQQWLRSLQSENAIQINNIMPLNGFSFKNNEALGNAFYAVMPVSRAADGTLDLRIPAFDSPNPIAPLPFSGQINIRVIGVVCDISNTDNIQTFEKELNINYTGEPVPSQQMNIELHTGAGKLVVVGVSVNGEVSGIVGAFYN
jgi:hypothetical protein